MLSSHQKLGNPTRKQGKTRIVVSLAYASGFLAIAILLNAIASADEHVTKNTANNKDVEFFEKQIAPILKRRCYECHSHESGKAKGGLVLDSRHGWKKGGSEGAAIVPSKPEESLLLQAVRYENYEMPPDERLPQNEIALLEEWIASGAADPRQSKVAKAKIDPAKLWALQPIAKPEIPIVNDTSWPRDDLDTFILARLEQEGLSPARDADRYTLLRRVTFDITGMPPTPEEIDQFVNDQSERAYEKVVDRLLDSPAFGDHWARHWFDLSCYADLAGLGGQTLIRDAWRYRDYVISSINSDKPMDRFIHEQIAGDLLPHSSIEQRREQIIATGYLAIGPYAISNYIKKQLDADVVDHQIDRIGRTFLAQTFSCARCHDHKFDPVPTRDYYAMAGIFHSTLTTSYDGPGVWSTITEVELPAVESTQQEAERRRKEREELQDQQTLLQAKFIPLVLRIPGASSANVLTLDEPIAANEKGLHYEVNFSAAPSVWASTPQATSKRDGIWIELLRSDGSLLAGHRHYPGEWSGGPKAQAMKPASFAYTGDGSGPVRIRVASATPGSQRFGGAVDDLSVSGRGEIVFAEDFNDLQPGSIVGKQPGTGLKILAQARIPGWSGDGINHSHAVDLGDGNFALQLFSGRTESLAKVKPISDQRKLAHTEALKIEKQLAEISTRILELQRKEEPERALAVRDIDSPIDSPIYRRGNFQSLGEVVPRGFPAAIHISQDYDIPENDSGRVQLAHWLTDSENPLTSRVLVNRIWHHLFGQGLVRTVDYFGVHGESPSHPKLLDFLATRYLKDDRWSLKKTIRRMVLSRTYQMASVHNAKALAIDPDNRLLWRMPRRRLTAESIRDAMLAASGELNHDRGGPALGLELNGNIRGLGGNVNLPTWAGKIPDYIKNRRSVYLPFRRSRPTGELEILSVFDFPHPSDMTGARPNTTVATQTLFLLNAPFVKQQASKLAERLSRDEPQDEHARINRLYLLTTSRPASSDEIETTMTFLNECTEDFNGNRTAAWTELCHAMLGSNGFLFRE